MRSFPSNFCYIKADADGTLTLTKQTGSDLPAGRLYPAGDKRYVFLGARQPRVGDNSVAYGTARGQRCRRRGRTVRCIPLADGVAVARWPQPRRLRADSGAGGPATGVAPWFS